MPNFVIVRKVGDSLPVGQRFQILTLRLRICFFFEQKVVHKWFWARDQMPVPAIAKAIGSADSRGQKP